VGIKGLGSFTKIGGSMIVMESSEEPSGRGYGTDSADNRQHGSAMIVPLLAYLVIGWYAFRGSIPKLSPVENIEEILQ
jgi:fucose permease